VNFVNGIVVAKTLLLATFLSIPTQSAFGFSFAKGFVKELWAKGEKSKKMMSALSKNEDLIVRFFQAVRNDNVAEVRACIKKGVNVNVGDELGRTALMFAARARNLAMVKLLLQANADVAVCDVNGVTVLEYALV
jgi:ankyrin repeat protein